MTVKSTCQRTISRLTVTTVESISRFLLEHSACDNVATGGTRLTLWNCVEDDLLEFIPFSISDVSKSDEVLRKFLESSCEYASIEEIYDAFLQLKMDSTITNPRARVLDQNK
ncbi:hypothetical protein GEMRC1_010236 [Eukaryota sp. GEM-RC1]